MEAITALQNAYGDSSDGESSNKSDTEIVVKADDVLHLKPLPSRSDSDLTLSTLKANPDVITKVSW